MFLKDKSDMVRIVLYDLRRELESQRLKASATLYAELYDEDVQLQELTESAMDGWPE